MITSTHVTFETLQPEEEGGICAHCSLVLRVGDPITYSPLGMIGERMVSEAICVYCAPVQMGERREAED